jgi:cytochrome b6-f complex iron-sulfur subunit
MADKKKMSVADMLAAARKADGGGAGEKSAEAALPAEPAPQAIEGAAPAGKPAPPAKRVAATGAARPSVAEMMAMARANAGGEVPAAPAKKPTVEKTAPAPKPAAKPAAVAKPAAAPAPLERESASVLGAAKKKDKLGPMSKAEAAANPVAPRTPAAPKIIVPPMPVKPDYAKPKAASKVVEQSEADEGRRDFLGIGFWLLGAISALWTLLTVKFMFPNVLREPPSKFKVGFPDAFPAGQVQEKFKAQFGIWVVNTEYNGKGEIFALKSVCTHLGCTPIGERSKPNASGSGFTKRHQFRGSGAAAAGALRNPAVG